MSESNPVPMDGQRTPEQNAAVRRRALPVAIAGVICALMGLVIAWTTPVGPYIPPSFLAMNLSFCAMLIGVGIFFYAKPTPGTGAAKLLSVLAVLAGMGGTVVYTRQAVLSRTQRENLELANVTAIAKAAAAYAGEHGGTYPADLLVLLEDGRIKPETLQSPLGASSDVFYHFDEVKAKAKDRAELLQTVETASDYIYLGGDLHTPPADLAHDIIVAVSTTTVERVSLALAFADGNAKFIDKDDVLDTVKACNAARAKLGLGPIKPTEIIQKVMDETPNK